MTKFPAIRVHPRIVYMRFPKSRDELEGEIELQWVSVEQLRTALRLEEGENLIGSTYEIDDYAANYLQRSTVVNFDTKHCDWFVEIRNEPNGWVSWVLDKEARRGS